MPAIKFRQSTCVEFTLKALLVEYFNIRKIMMKRISPMYSASVKSFLGHAVCFYRFLPVLCRAKRVHDLVDEI